MKGIQVLDRPASQSFYAVAGRLLFIQAFDRHLAGLIEQLFAGHECIVEQIIPPEMNQLANGVVQLQDTGLALAPAAAFKKSLAMTVSCVRHTRSDVKTSRTRSEQF